MKVLIIVILKCLLVTNLVFQQGSETNKVDANGLKQGKWVKFYPNGKVMYSGVFKDNKPIGLLNRYYKSGVVKAEMFFYDDDKTYAKLFYTNKKIGSEGNFINSKKDSIWNYYSNAIERNIIAKENYVLGLKNGKSQTFSSKGNLTEEISWKDDVKNGPWQTFFQEGGDVRTQVLYRDGKLNGVFNSFYASGRIDITGKYVDGLRNGDWLKYDVDGKETSKTTYVKGVPENRDEIIENFMKEYEENIIKSRSLKDPEKEPPMF